jgi:hypothetical protein
VITARTDFIFKIGNSEQQNRVDAERLKALAFAQNIINRKLKNIRHRRNFALEIFAFGDEQRINKIVFRQMRFAKHIAQSSVFTQPAQTRNGKIRKLKLLIFILNSR